jgi:hypothetical protein
MKNQAEKNVKDMSCLNMSTIITEKEKIQLDLAKALDEIDKLKTLVAENTLHSLFTVPNMYDD